MTGLALELRRGPGKLLVIPLALVGVLVIRQAIPPGPAVWPAVVSALALGMVAMGPVAGGVAALAGTRSHRRRTDTLELLATRGPAAAGLAELGALLVWVSGAFVLVLGATYLPAAATATWSGPDGLRSLTTGVGLLLEVVIGYVLGRLVPSRLTPAVVALVFYGLVGYIDASRTLFRWSLLLPVNLQFADEFSILNRTAFIGQLVWYLGLGLLVAAGWAVGRQSRSAVAGAALAVGAATTVAGLVVLLPQNGRATFPAAPAVWDCAGSAPEVCLHPAFASAAPAVTAAVTPVAGRLAGTPFAIRRAEHRPRGIGSIPSPGAVAFALDDTAPGSIRLVSQELAVNALGDQESCFTDTGLASGYDLAQLVAAWVAGDPSLYQPTPDSPSTTADHAAQRWFAGLHQTRRRAWLTRNEQAIRACTLRPSAFR